ncbi:MAG TPA: GNAT family protein [Accumulibacter sp.]|nr:GNAT family protein [Accumulibacter sp.]HMW18079.1 GNAT family protein [Accumulibacter sp.]HNC18139.1 GNAT family protein [Accumulibacter sp.]HND80686.1 GNAT family protein [Accumulibacter sp.]HNE13375.1 GNAT family protein [Accumulibacter sp.]
MAILNSLGQHVSEPLVNWRPPAAPQRVVLSGQWARLEPLQIDRHAASLHVANLRETSSRHWTYLAYGPFVDESDYRQWLSDQCLGDDPLFYAIVSQKSGEALGLAAYLRIAPASGSLEIGHLHFSPALQRGTAASEAIYLLLKNAFALGYRRVEWKCDALNAPSRTAAERYGWSFEGIFRQATVVKGRNRDTAWYAVIDRDWPALQSAFVRWLHPNNFDSAGRQRLALSALTRPLLADRR